MMSQGVIYFVELRSTAHLSQVDIPWSTACSDTDEVDLERSVAKL